MSGSNGTNNSYISSFQQRLQEAARAGLGTANAIISEATASKNTEPKASDTSNKDSETELVRLRKIESRFVDLARAYKAIKSKQDDIESIIAQNSEIADLKSPEKLQQLGEVLRSSKDKFDSNQEITKLVRQINELKQQHEAEIDTNTAMYTAIQAKLVSREEVHYFNQEINKLKRNLNKLEGLGITIDSVGTPTEMNPSLNEVSDPAILLQKINELSAKLQSVSTQRNSAIEKLKGSQNPIPETDLLSNESLSQLASLQLKYDNEVNAGMILKQRIKQLSAENSQISSKLEDQMKKFRDDEQTINRLREQINSMVDEMAEITDEASKHRRQVEELKKKLEIIERRPQDSEEVHHQAREKYIAMEHRLESVEQKLKQNEKQRESLDSRNQELLQEISVERKNSHAMKETTSKLNAKILELETSLKKSMEEYNHVKSILEISQSHTNELQLNVGILKKQIGSYEANPIPLVKPSSEVEVNSAGSDNIYRQLSIEISNMAEELKQLQDLKIRKENQFNLNLQKEKDLNISLRTELQSLQAKLNETNSESYEKNVNLSNMVQTNLHELSELLDRSKELQLLESNNREDGIEILHLNNALKISHLEILALFDLNQAQSNVINDINAQLENSGNYRADSSELLQKLNNSIEKLKTVEIENCNLELKMTEMSLEINNLKDKLSRSIDSERIQSQIADIGGSLGQCLRETDRFKLENNEFRDSLDASKTLIFELQSANNALQQKLAAVENTQTQGDVNLDNSQKLQSLESEIESLKKEKLGLEQELKAELEKMDNLTLKYDSALKKIEQQQSEIDKISMTEADPNSEAGSELLSKIENLESFKRSSVVSLQESELNAANLETELATTKQQLKEEQEKKTKSIQLLRNSNNKITKLERIITTKEDQLKDVFSSLESCKKDFKKNEVLLQERSVQLKDNIKKLEESLRTIANLEKNVAEKDSIIKAMEKERSALQNQISDLRDSKSQSEKALRATIAEFDNDKKSETKKLQNIIDGLNSNLEQLTESLKTADKQLELKEKEFVESKNLLEAKIQESEELKETFSKMEVELFEKTQHINNLVEELSSKETELDFKIKRMESLSSEIQKFKENNTTVQNELGEKNKELELLKAKIIEYDAEFQKLNLKNHQNGMLSDIQAAFELKIHELTLILEKTKSERDKYEIELQNLKDDFRIRESQLKNLNSSLKDEVRKITRSASSSAVTSPALSRAESMEISTASSQNRKLPSPEPEYVKNVVLKFLETTRKSQKAQLIGVLGMILGFTPQEMALAQNSVS